MLVNLRALREDRDLSQKAMADILNIHQTTYSDYELGRLNIPTAALVRLALYFETSSDYILGLTDEAQPYPRAKRLPL